MSITVHYDDIEGVMKTFAEANGRQWVGRDGANRLPLSVSDILYFLHFPYDQFFASAKSGETDTDNKGGA